MSALELLIAVNADIDHPHFSEIDPVLLEILPLTTEELFMDKLASLGYSVE